MAVLVWQGACRCLLPAQPSASDTSCHSHHVHGRDPQRSQSYPGTLESRVPTSAAATTKSTANDTIIIASMSLCLLLVL